jgi:tartrate dehydrogenase/decarboxylase / D-malate dehydrogenase
MKQFSIAVIPGDGIGQEVMPEALKVVDHLAPRHGASLQFEHFDWGTGHYFAHGRMMPPGALDRLRAFDAILLGAVGHPDVPDHTTLNGLLLPIRRTFDQYACVRPAKLYPGVSSPLKGKAPGSIDMIVVRENTEGEYSQVGGRLYEHKPTEVAIQTAVFTRHGVERIMRFAFDLARRRDRKKLTSITKSNAQGYSMVLWDHTFAEVAREYPDIETESLLVDAAAMNFVRRPESFDVVVASNLFGDILSDISAIVTGSLGLAASANLNPSREFPSMFEPTHGSAPDIAGRGISNPMAMILTAGMMLDFLGLEQAGAEVEKGVMAVLSEGQTLPADLGGSAGTSAIGQAVIEKLS